MEFWRRLQGELDENGQVFLGLLLAGPLPVGTMALYSQEGCHLAGADYIPKERVEQFCQQGQTGIFEFPPGYKVFGEVITTPVTMVIFGGGHIAVPLVKMAHIVGFQVVVVDDRSEFANSKRFPNAREIIVADFAEAFKRIQITTQHFLVIITRGHSHDRKCLQNALKTNAGYIGMIGSERKVQATFAQLKKEGIPESALTKVSAPIGLPINAGTPAEIAVSILAEAIKIRSTYNRASEMYELVSTLARGEVKAGVLATIVAARGSTPRGVGARLLLTGDGSVIGTVGGGAGEAKVIQAAKKVLKTREPQLLSYSLDNSTAAAAGMICGGSFKVFIQPVPNDK